MKHLQGILIPTKRQEVNSLVQKLWIPESRKTTLCIDSYENGILQGRFYGQDREIQSFRSLSQFLILMEGILDRTNEPQSDTTPRSFRSILQQVSGDFSCGRIPKGTLATFELQILFRQHTSWQGRILWQDQHMEQSFRSVLELILLMDSALRGLEGREAV